MMDGLRRNPLQVRKATLASIVAKARPGIRFNEHIEGDGPTVFAHACKMGLEGIVSKRKDSVKSPTEADAIERFVGDLLRARADTLFTASTSGLRTARTSL